MGWGWRGWQDSSYAGDALIWSSPTPVLPTVDILGDLQWVCIPLWVIGVLQNLYYFFSDEDEANRRRVEQTENYSIDQMEEDAYRQMEVLEGLASLMW